MPASQSPGLAIQVQGLEKSYKQLGVLRGVDFEVARGSIVAVDLADSVLTVRTPGRWRLSTPPGNRPEREYLEEFWRTWSFLAERL